VTRTRALLGLILLLVLVGGGAATRTEASLPIETARPVVPYRVPSQSDPQVVSADENLPPMPPTPPSAEGYPTMLPGTDRYNIGAIPPGSPGVESMLYRFFDEGNDWQNWHPEWGPIGSIRWCMWETVSKGEGIYDWSAMDRYIASERNLKVTLPDGTEIPKPIVIQMFPYISSAYDWSGVYFYDGTPEWVYDKIDQQNPSDPRPIINGRKVGYLLYGCGTKACLPMYDSYTWREAFYDTVRAFGARYGNDPQITAVFINTGLDGETQLVKDWGCSWNYVIDTQYTDGLRYRFGQFLDESMAVYRQAFPNKAIFISNAPGGSGVRAHTARVAASFDPPVGLKNASMTTDIDSHEGFGDFTGMWDHVREYSMTLPIMLETRMGYGDLETKYWTYLAGLHYHPDAMDVHPDYLTDPDPAYLRWVGEHLGVTLDDTPSIWTVLRDSEWPVQDWGSGGCSGHQGDWVFWLERKDVPGGYADRIWKSDLPRQREVASIRGRRDAPMRTTVSPICTLTSTTAIPMRDRRRSLRQGAMPPT